MFLNSNKDQLLLHLHLLSSAFYFCCLCCVSTDWTFQMCVYTVPSSWFHSLVCDRTYCYTAINTATKVLL